MNATQPLKILMPPGRRRDDSEKPQSPGNLFPHSEKEKGRTAHPVLAYFDSPWGRCPQTLEVLRFWPIA